MKYFMSCALAFFCFFSFGIFSQEKEIREDMVVINVEIPVRVMYKGKPVDNLKKSDNARHKKGEYGTKDDNAFFQILIDNLPQPGNHQARAKGA